MEGGRDCIMFPVDYPFEEAKEACTWFDQCDASERDRRKMGRENAIRLFGLHK